MISKDKYNNFITILKSELVMALGCTEPIAIAYSTAKAQQILGEKAERIEVGCSGNIIKNVKGVVVPNTGGLIGIKAAAIAGIISGDADRELEVLESITEDQYSEIKELEATDFCTVYHVEGVENLYIKSMAVSGDTTVEVTIQDSHTNIVKVTKNGEVIFENYNEVGSFPTGDRSQLSVKGILEFADSVSIGDVKILIDRQIDMNSAISQEGLDNDYGVKVGKTLLKHYGDDIKVRAKAKAAAGSDARMGGSSLPVVINSGSGNQGITASIPVIEYAMDLGVKHEKLIRALVVSNLVSILQKEEIGKLSAYCGAVSAAAGSGAGIGYLHDATYEQISDTVTNTIANVGGMVCDGAKPSCAAKIASAVDAAILGFQMSCEGNVFKDGEGLVKEDVEMTIKSVGRLGKIGMEGTDIEIIKIMLD